MNKQEIQNILEKMQKKNAYLPGIILRVDTPEASWKFSVGKLHYQQQYFIASTTKLYTTALVFKMCAEKRLNLSDKITQYFPHSLLSGLHTFKKKDYTGEITIGHLLSHTSGLADYFQQKTPRGKSLQKRITSGQDEDWTFEDCISLTRSMQAAFSPGTEKAFYSDTNFQILGKILENISGQSYNDLLQHSIFNPLNLANTYLYNNPEDSRPAPLHFRSRQLNIPKAMSSFGSDGGIVSTADDCMLFIKAFFAGELFPKSYLANQQWRRMFFPLDYGLGLMRFSLPRILFGFRSFPELLGHSGLSGAFAFYCPARNIYFSGTVNQVSSPRLLFMLLGRILALK